jgi:hypothetical protein
MKGAYMHTIRIVVLFVVGSICAGCSGAVYTNNNVSFDNKGNLEGVVFYPPALFKEISATTVALNKDGKIIGRASDNTCEPVRSEKIITAPDYSQPRRIWYHHGLLETYTFGVTLDAAGDLTAVNSQSTPDQGKTFQNIASGFASIAPAAGLAGAQPGAPTACTDGPIIIGRQKFGNP